jgi:hypothetical protein
MRPVHYQQAWDKLASYEKDWSRKNVEDYEDLKELNRLGSAIKIRLQDRVKIASHL